MRRYWIFFYYLNSDHLIWQKNASILKVDYKIIIIFIEINFYIIETIKILIKNKGHTWQIKICNSLCFNHLLLEIFLDSCPWLVDLYKIIL